MRPLRSLFMLVMLSAFATGCTTTMHYPMDSGMYQFEKKGSVKVLLNVIEDDRSEVSPKVDGVIYSNDSFFSEKIDIGATEVIKAHLEKSDAISTVDIKEIRLPLSAASKEQYKQQGYDFILSAKLKNFHGYQETMIPIFLLFGPPGVFLEMAVNHKDVGGHTEYSDIEVIALSEKALPWSGNIKQEFNESVVWYSGHLEYAKSSLKSANNELAEVIDQFVIQDTPIKSETNSSLSEHEQIDIAQQQLK